MVQREQRIKTCSHRLDLNPGQLQWAKNLWAWATCSSQWAKWLSLETLKWGFQETRSPKLVETNKGVCIRTNGIRHRRWWQWYLTCPFKKTACDGGVFQPSSYTQSSTYAHNSHQSFDSCKILNCTDRSHVCVMVHINQKPVEEKAVDTQPDCQGFSEDSHNELHVNRRRRTHESPP